MTVGPFTYTETLTVVRQQAVDPFGDPTGSPTDTEVDGCVVWPTASTEQTGTQDTVTSDLTVLMPVGTDVRPTDRVIRAGVTYEVQGQPQHFASPFTDLDPGVVVALREVTG